MLFTEKEKRIITDTEFLTTKLAVIEKIQNIFNDVHCTLRTSIEKSEFNFPSNVDIKFGKIFRGENYKSLPYVTLDYPKLFSNDDTFTFRTMFWWGNYFSATLHLEGKSLERYRNNIIKNAPHIFNNQIYICVNSSPWEYHYEKDNYVLLDESKLNILHDTKFVKLSSKFCLDQYSKIPFLSDNVFKSLLNILAN